MPDVCVKDRVLWRGYVHTVVGLRPKTGECLIEIHGSRQWVHAERLTVVG
jgi:hypothetical protein